MEKYIHSNIFIGKKIKWRYIGEDENGENYAFISKRTKTVLTKMKELEYITEEQYNEAITEVDPCLTPVIYIPSEYPPECHSQAEARPHLYHYHLRRQMYR